jgi:putative flippase GtrA
VRSAGRVSGVFDSTVIRFIVTGGGAAALFFVLSVAFVTTGAPPFWGSLAAYAVAFLASYLLQRGWTFRSLHRHGHALPRYLILQLGCALSSAAAAQALVSLFAAPVLLMSFIATGFAGVVSYVLSSKWVFPMAAKIVNKQYNVAEPDSLSVRVATFQRQRMYQRFLWDTAIASGDTILDVGVTSDQSYSSSNYLEAWYPAKSQITAAGIDDASFLKTLYPGLTFVQANGLDLPFPDGSYDFVHSSAVLEHVGSFENQIRFIAECARVARKALFLTTPNRWFPIEFHTVLPLVHWLPKPAFRGLMRRTGRGFFAEEANLNLMTANELRTAARSALDPARFDIEVSSASLAGWPSNLLLLARLKPAH